MPWVRIDENAMDHPKIGGLPPGAFVLWVQGLAYCQRHLTDGFISNAFMRVLTAFSPKRRDNLLSAGLWDKADGGITVHDYLQWNDSRADVLEARRFAKLRMALVRDPELRRAIQTRDGQWCRYCGKTVNWSDRKGARGATYDHIIPGGPDDLSNLVTACRGCNSRKRDRTPEEAGMSLLQPRSDLDKSSTNTTPHHLTPHRSKDQERNQGKGAPRPSESDEWFAECQRLHGGTCGGSLKHQHQMILDRKKGA